MAVNFVTDTFQGNPAVTPPASRVGGQEKVCLGSFETLTITLDATDDVLILAKLPADCVLLEYSVGHDDLDTGAALLLDYGVTDKDGANIAASGTDSRERFANAVASGGAVALTDRRFASLAPAAVANIGQPLWQLAGMLANPGRHLFLCIRVSTAPTGGQAGTVFWRIRFVDNS